MERRKLFDLPNSISLSRLLLALVFVIVDSPGQRIALILAAGATDVLDGWLARRAKSLSVAGALIDPIADRVFVLAAVSSYLFEGLLTTGEYFVFLSRDVATAVGFVVARFIPGLGAESFKARPLGKAVTVLQLATLLAVLAAPSIARPLIWMVGIVSVFSIVDYTAALERARRAARSGKTAPGLIALAAVMSLAVPAEAQAPVLEGRADVIAGRHLTAHAGAGLIFPVGTYLRTGIIAAAGSSRDGLSGRLDLVNRFHLDPFRESRWAPYAAGGVTALFDEGRRTRGYLLVLVGVDGPPAGGITPSLEAGLGGGTRVGVAIRTARGRR